MLYVDKQQLKFEAIEQEARIFEKELSYIYQDLEAIGTQSALLAGFAFDQLNVAGGEVTADDEEETVSGEVQMVLVLIAAVAFVCNMLAVCSSTFLVSAATHHVRGLCLPRALTLTSSLSAFPCRHPGHLGAERGTAHPGRAHGRGDRPRATRACEGLPHLPGRRGLLPALLERPGLVLLGQVPPSSPLFLSPFVLSERCTVQHTDQ